MLPILDNYDSFPAGAGVVADSDPTYEYVETVNKSKALLSAIALARTLGPEN